MPTDKFRGVDTDEGWQRRALADLQRQITELSSARRLVFLAGVPVQVDNNGLDLATTWTQYLTTTIAVPAGYKFATVTLIATVGDTVSGAASSTNNGNVGAEPYVVADTNVAGPALSQGKTGGGAVSIQSAMTTKVGVSAGVLQVCMFAYANGGPWNSLAGNLHLNGSVIFSRS